MTWYYIRLNTYLVSHQCDNVKRQTGYGTWGLLSVSFPYWYIMTCWKPLQSMSIPCVSHYVKIVCCPKRSGGKIVCYARSKTLLHLATLSCRLVSFHSQVSWQLIQWEFFDNNLHGGATTDSFFQLKQLVFLRLHLDVSDVMCIVTHTSPLRTKWRSVLWRRSAFPYNQKSVQ